MHFFTRTLVVTMTYFNETRTFLPEHEYILTPCVTLFYKKIEPIKGEFLPTLLNQCFIPCPESGDQFHGSDTTEYQRLPKSFNLRKKRFGI